MLENIEKEIKDLGILNIEANGELTLDLLEDAVKSVKEFYSNVNIDELAKKKEQNLKNNHDISG